VAQIKLAGIKRKGVEKQNFTVKIDQEVLDDLVALEERMAKESPDLQVSRPDVVENALREFIKDANSHLDKLAKPAEGGSSSAKNKGGAPAAAAAG
jgi:hypothetical protein